MADIEVGIGLKIQEEKTRQREDNFISRMVAMVSDAMPQGWAEVLSILPSTQFPDSLGLF